MILKLILDEQIYELNLPENFLAQASGFFDKMDQDMDAGWQMGREWVERPDRLQRCQVAAEKLVSALENDNDELGRMMAGYICSRVPEIDTVEPNLEGEIQDTRFTFRSEPAPPPRAAPAANPGLAGQDKMAALGQAGREVSKVFKSGRHYRFSVYNQAAGAWEDSPAVADEQQAKALREQAVRRRYDELLATRH